MTVGGIGTSSIAYSADNNEIGTWSSTLTTASAADPFYPKASVGAGYSGPITITWKLQQKGASGWTDVSGATFTTSMYLDGSAQRTVYATDDGTYAADNYDWGSKVDTSGTYRVFATVNSA